MMIEILKGKIHRATVTQADLNYVGSITIDKTLLEKSNIHEYEKVQIVDVNNGNRFETYVIAGPKDSGIICLNGAAARCACVGDKVIIMSYAYLNEDEVSNYKPKVVTIDNDNKAQKTVHYEKYGQFTEELMK